MAILGVIATLLGAAAVIPSQGALAAGGSLTSQAVCGLPAPGHVACMARVIPQNQQQAHQAGHGISPSTSTPDVISGYTPADIQAAYGLPANGVGLTVGIVDAYDNPNAEADLAAYRTHWGLFSCTTANGCFLKINQNGQTAPMPATAHADGTCDPTSDPLCGWGSEIDLDIEAVSAACPLCHIILVEANSSDNSDMFIAVDEAVTAGAEVLSLSWGGPEDPGETTLDTYLNHSGVAIMSSAGDNGYGTSYPAASPYVTAVGGTSLNHSGSWSETAWSGTGSGCSPYENKPPWQSGVTDANCSTRMLNDVSAVADPNHGLAVYDNFDFGGWAPYSGGIGGTSLSSPVIAGAYALAGGEKTGTTGAHGFYSDWALTDVTSGSNGVCAHAYFCNAEVGYDGPTGLGTPKSVPVSATPGSMSFGPQAFGTPFASQTATVTNNQASAATTVTASLSGPNSSNFSATPVGCASLAASSSCTVTVQFTPSQPGTETATLTLHDSTSSGTHVLPLTGIAGLTAYTMSQNGPTYSSNASQPLPGPNWGNWAIARDIEFQPGTSKGYLLDGYGGINPINGATPTYGGPYWGWDIARAIALAPNGTSGFVLDGYGGIHPFGGASMGAGSSSYFGWDIARDIVVNPCDGSGRSGYVLDGYGGVHPFGGAPAMPQQTAYWGGWDVARRLALNPSSACNGLQPSGYVLDAYGGIHSIGGAPAVTGDPYFGFNIARDIELTSTGAGYVLDGYGGTHQFGGAPGLNSPGYQGGHDVFRAMSVA